MFHVQYLSYLILLHSIVSIPQINLYYTDRVSENENYNAFQHDCLRVAANIDEVNVRREMISYCMSELQSEFNVEENEFIPKFTFAQLLQQNISSEQLYLWSAPIDLIEHYQFYLNQLSTLNDSSLETQIFYNCTLPRFGTICQYEFDYYHLNHSSLYEIITDFYRSYPYERSNLTCYIHLQCNRDFLPICLDWSEICNGKVDCVDGEYDEEYCWQIELNQCKDNEYQCYNGQCIPQSFYRDDQILPDCLDGSDEITRRIDRYLQCNQYQPSFECEEFAYQQLFTQLAYERNLVLLLPAMFSIKDKSVSDQCWSAIKCRIDRKSPIDFTCITLCGNDMCIDIIERECPDMLYIPTIPVLFGHIYFAYRKYNSPNLYNDRFQYPYMCYNNSLYDAYFVNASKVLFNHTTCYYRDDLIDVFPHPSNWYEQYLLSAYRDLWEYNQIWKYNGSLDYFSKICNRSHMYPCVNSLKCIPTTNLMDFVYHCPRGDDENKTMLTNFILEDPPVGEVSNFENEEIKAKYRYARNNISFQTICDGFVDLLPVYINGQNETDETECEQWQCDNIYTRCNGQWNCLNGADELTCDLSIPLNYSSDHHKCVSLDTYQLMYLHIRNANDGKVDCLGATDEPTLCRAKYTRSYAYNFYCKYKNYDLCLESIILCNGWTSCEHEDDQRFCTIIPSFAMVGICWLTQLSNASDIEKFICERMKPWERQPIIYFSLDEMNMSVPNSEKIVQDTIFSRSSIIEMFGQHQFHCHHGLSLRVWLNNKNNITRNTCLCPPSYYGSRCQYQNQRISLSIKFRVFSDSWQIPFQIIFLLIDDSNERIINSYEQLTYLSIRDCQIKYNFYLLYSTRPKNLTKNYSIHIDIYEKISLIYRGSLFFPINFQFLPVHRLPLIIDIPQSDNNSQKCSNHQCIHGKCIKYSNTRKNITFCQCNKGWSGRYCTIPHSCICASDSICIGVTANNRSICICPINKFGPRCLLIDSICQTNINSTCDNNGQCISNNDPMIPNKKFTCICPKGFMGDRCELAETQLIVSFGKDIVLSQSIFIHFIETITDNTPIRGTTFRTISIRQDSVIIYWARSFHLVFIELLDKTYYLAVFQKSYNQSNTFITMINSSDRCLHISEIFNQSFAKLHLLRRIKYYHLSCQIQSLNLSCFYDDIHLCICYNHRQKRLANCFEFNHNMTFDCLGQSVCKNGAQCVQDKLECPSRSMCICLPCFYGRLCQFSTSGFGLSLDGILSYHILPNISLTYQPAIIQISSALTIIFNIVGLINGVFVLITFKNKSVHKVGCGLYLLGSSITTLLTTMMFGLKFWILILTQMTIISNRSFLSFQCHSIDFLLQVFLNMDQWLNACVAMERAMNVIKGVTFNKKKSRQVAKIVIIIVPIFIIASFIHDPIYRQLIDEDNDIDNNQKKIWCIITYPSNIQTFNSVMNIFHFLAPFIINLISAIILITKKSHQQSNIHPNQTYKELLCIQFQQHKHLFTAPVILVILAVPRLIISFLSKCMKSAGDSWLFLVAYFVSFIPSMLTFIIFILPSKFYTTEFRNSVIHYKTTIQRRLYLTS